MEKMPAEILRLSIITSCRKKDALLLALAPHKPKLLTTNYASGTITANFLENLIGLIPEEEKVMINCLIKKKQKAAIFTMLQTDFHFDRPNTGIAFTATVTQLVF